LSGQILLPSEDLEFLSNYKNIIEKNLEDIAKLVSIEHGKTLDDAKGSVTRGLEVVEFCMWNPTFT
jgi:NAD-dependent aldehyde dehydrogenases